MLEKEIKILEIDSEFVQNNLLKLWAVKTFEWFIHDIYFDFPKWDMEYEDRIFRTRRKWETHLYTIKRKRKQKWLKVADECEKPITDIVSFHKVLEKYGMEKTREKKKHRISYSLDWIEFDIDDYYLADNDKKIPTLLEIEAPKKKHIKKYINLLWLDNHIQKTFWSRKLFDYYGIEYNYFV